MGLLDVMYGRAAHWADWSDDLAIESQASYLRRHRLMTMGELRRLPPKAFEPEAIVLDTPVFRPAKRGRRQDPP
jgi:hypothetical protein